MYSNVGECTGSLAAHCREKVISVTKARAFAAGSIPVCLRSFSAWRMKKIIVALVLVPWNGKEKGRLIDDIASI